MRTSGGSGGCASSKAPRSPTSALAGGLLAGWTSPRVTYFLTIPFVLASIIAFSRFREPRLHRAAEPLALRRHVATTVGAMTRIPSVRRMLLLAALTALLSQAIFEFGPLWLVALHAPAAAFGPYWALFVATLGAGGYLAARLHLGRRSTALAVAAILAGRADPAGHQPRGGRGRGRPSRAATDPRRDRDLRRAPAARRRPVPSSAPACPRAPARFSWMLFLPFSLGFGALARSHGVYPAGWIFVGTCVALAMLLVLSTRAAQNTPAKPRPSRPGCGDRRDPRRRPAPLLTPPPDDLACRDLVRLVSDYLDGELPSDWRASIDDHLAPATAAPPTRSRSSRPSRCSNRSTRSSTPHPSTSSEAPHSPGDAGLAYQPGAPARGGERGRRAVPPEGDGDGGVPGGRGPRDLAADRGTSQGRLRPGQGPGARRQ